MDKLLSICLFMLLSLTACTPDRQNQENVDGTEIPPEERAEKAMVDEIIIIHDEVMPKMDNLMMLKAKLQKKLDSLMFEETGEREIIELQNKIEKLRKADSAMMSWMRQFRAVRDTVTHEKRMDYLEREKERIERVRKMMNEAIAEGENTGS